MVRKIVIFSVILVFLSLINYSNPIKCQEPEVDGVFKAVHLINLNADTSEAELQKILDELNNVITELGYTDIKYQLWKERGDTEGKYKYIFESKWPSQGIYDKVHNSDSYKKITEKYKTGYKELIKEEDYSRYIPLN